MRLFLVALCLGALVGWSMGGNLRVLATLALRGPFLLPAALVAQLALGVPPLAALEPRPRFAVILVSYALVGLWLALNAWAGPPTIRHPLALFATGWVLNLVVMVPNGGMPVSPSGIEHLGLPATTEVNVGYLSKHVAASDSTVLLALADIIPAPALRSVLSIGDVVMALGLAMAVAAGMHRPPGTAGRTEPASADGLRAGPDPRF